MTDLSKLVEKILETESDYIPTDDSAHNQWHVGFNTAIRLCRESLLQVLKDGRLFTERIQCTEHDHSRCEKKIEELEKGVEDEHKTVKSQNDCIIAQEKKLASMWKPVSLEELEKFIRHWFGDTPDGGFNAVYYPMLASAIINRLEGRE